MDEYISRADYCEATCGPENREGYKECVNCAMLNVPTANVQPIDVKTRLNSMYGLLAKYPHIIRMYDELTELKGRYAKLMQYYDDHRSQLDDKQQDLMMSQRSIMEHYIGVLEARLNYDNQLYSKEET